MTKKETKERLDLKNWLTVFEGIKEEEAKAHITENVYERKISKGLIAAYLTAYHKKDDNAWFKAACMEKKPKTALSVAVDAEGKPIYKVNKDGKVALKKVRVTIAGEYFESYNHNKAKKAFIEHFGIVPKSTGFTPKAKKEEAEYNIFEGLF